MLDVLATIFWGLVVLIFLVVTHELGHFVAARSYGVRVTEFMIGLPGPNVGFEYKGTRFGVTCIPLGGYNRITGMESGPEDPNLEQVLAYVYRQGSSDVEHTAAALGISEDDAEVALMILDGWGSINEPGRCNPTDKYAAPKTEEYELGEAREVEDPKALLDSERKQTYRGLSFPKRLVVLFAGPLMNIVIAFVILTGMFCIAGVSVASTTLSDVVEDGPAAEAGMQAGDTIVGVDGQETEDWDALSSAIAGLEVGQVVDVEYERDGERKTAEVTVGASEDDEDSPYLGVYAGTETKHYSIAGGLQASWAYFVATVGAYVSLVNPATTVETVEQSTSVVGIAVMSKEAAEVGPVSLLYIVAVISLSLGIVNLLPVPPLDGGKIVIEIVQRISGRDVPTKVINAITVVAMALLLILFIVLLRQDIVRFVLGG